MQETIQTTHKQLPKTLPSFIWHFAKKYKKMLFAITTACVFGALFMDAILPYSIKVIIDRINSYNGTGTIIGIIKIPLCIYMVSWIIMDILWMLTDNVLYIKSISKIQKDVSNTVFQYLQQHSYSYFQNNLSGRLSSKINDLANGIESILGNGIANIGTILFALIFTAIVSATINPIFSYVFIIWSICYITLAILLSKKIASYSEIWSDKKTIFSGKVIDIITNILSVKSFANSRYEKSRIAKSVDEIYTKEKGMFRFKLKARFIKDILGLSLIAINTFLLSKLISQKLITIGDFVFIFNSTLHIMWTIRWISQIISDTIKNIGVCRQALEVINIPHSIANKPNAKSFKTKNGKIEFKNIVFGYHKDSKPVFKNLNLIIEPHSKVGLVGLSGAGKSTLINLIMRFFDINSGEIRIDNQNVQDVTQESLREDISLIPQSPSLFHRTIRENIGYGKLDATNTEIIEASKKANCHEFIMALPHGYDTLVGERGIKLSGGQRQRIAIARVILKNTPILILDEATSALDSYTEKCIQDSMKVLMQNKTVIAIAHRLSTLQNMDRILVFGDGKIIEDGNHKQLLRKKGEYAKLWHMQTNGFIPEEEENNQ